MHAAMFHSANRLCTGAKSPAHHYLFVVDISITNGASCPAGDIAW